MTLTAVPLAAEHADAVLRIYQEGLDTGNASFETDAPSWSSFDAAHLTKHRFVVVDDTGDVVAWSALSPVSSRCVYAGVAESSVYAAACGRGRGAGRQALAAVIESSERDGIWTLQAGIFPENTPSLRLHELMGFRVVGIRERVGRHHGQWRDVILLERRSKVAGN